MEKIDAKAFTRTLTGFDEIGIKRMFGAGLGELDGGIVPRAILWVAERREGMNDGDAFRKVMEMPLGDLEEKFEDPDPAEGLGKAPATDGMTPGPISS